MSHMPSQINWRRALGEKFANWVSSCILEWVKQPSSRRGEQSTVNARPCLTAASLPPPFITACKQTKAVVKNIFRWWLLRRQRDLLTYTSCQSRCDLQYTEMGSSFTRVVVTPSLTLWKSHIWLTLYFLPCKTKICHPVRTGGGKEEWKQ